MIKHSVARSPVCDVCASSLNDTGCVDAKDMGIVPQVASDRGNFKVDWIKGGGMDGN
jgi:hypothetical protein